MEILIKGQFWRILNNLEVPSLISYFSCHPTPPPKKKKKYINIFQVNWREVSNGQFPRVHLKWMKKTFDYVKIHIH